MVPHGHWYDNVTARQRITAAGNNAGVSTPHRYFGA